MREAKRLRLITVNPAYDLVGSIKASRVVHRPALSLSRLPELQERIDTYKGRALTRLTVLLSLHVFVRSSELRFARWSEFDLKRGVWEIPDTRPALEGNPFPQGVRRWQAISILYPYRRKRSPCSSRSTPSPENLIWCS